MADHGAWVGLIEPPSGSPVRRRPPFRDEDERNSVLFWHLNSGKHSIALDASDPAQWRRLVALCRNADAIIIADRALARRIELECPYSVVGLVTDFGADGPYSHWIGSELIHQALSGSMFVSGLPERQPLFGVGERASYAAGLWLYVSMLAALYGRKAFNESYGMCEVTIHEAAAAMEENFSHRWAYSRHLMRRGGDSSRAVCTLTCKDGSAILFVRSVSGQWDALCKVLGDEDLARDNRFKGWAQLTRNWKEAGEEINRRSAHWRVDDLVAKCAPVELIIARVEDAESLRNDPHLRSRGFLEKCRYAFGPAHLSRRVDQYPLGPRTPRSSCTGFGRRRREPAQRAIDLTALTISRAAQARPLRGVTIIDLTTAWAGPMSTRILALLGADVIKVEGPLWLDSWRGPLAPSPLRAISRSRSRRAAL